MKAVFLDRDGVINEAVVKEMRPFPPDNLEELKIIAGVEEALINLSNKGFKLIVVTNQPDVKRGKTSIEQVNKINTYLQEILSIDAIYCCFHDDQDNCNCRKPKPGLIEKACDEFSINSSESYMVGDRWRDVEAGFAAGCRTFFIDYGYNEKQPTNFDFRVQSLLEASKIILGEDYE
tara:strand:- start:43 stop:573 length:531 start_codon:yes stop_codon:yes gene_type:complete